jgi:hypothetical protein
MAGSARPVKSFDESVTLVASAVVTADSTGTTEVRLPVCNAVGFVLNCTAAATDVGDILAAFIQTRVGDMWVDVVAFTTVLGNGGAKRYFAKVSAGLAETMFENASALAAGSVRNLHGDAWRARYTVTDASTDNASFTFSITAIPM